MFWNRPIFVNIPRRPNYHSFSSVSSADAMPETTMEVQQEDESPKAANPPQGEYQPSDSPNSGDSEGSGDESPMEEDDKKKPLYPDVKMSLIEQALEVATLKIQFLVFI